MNRSRFSFAIYNELFHASPSPICASLVATAAFAVDILPATKTFIDKDQLKEHEHAVAATEVVR